MLYYIKEIERREKKKFIAIVALIILCLVYVATAGAEKAALYFCDQCGSSKTGCEHSVTIDPESLPNCWWEVIPVLRDGLQKIPKGWEPFAVTLPISEVFLFHNVWLKRKVCGKEVE